MNSRNLILPLFVMCCAASVSANDLKESVCFIERHRDAGSSGEQIVKVLQDNSFISASKKLDSYVSGRSVGSGFVVRSASGVPMVVTNRHVVGNARKVDVNFQIGGANVKYAACDVAKVFDDIDLAVVMFTEDGVKCPPLEVSKSKPEDGTEVWTAGFPVLANKPSWQLGKGIVSNNSVRDEYFGNVDSVSVYQHTAEVDPGSSGGPLLVRNEKGDYVVIGINTWKASFRENTNFSIPAKFIDKYNSISASASPKKKDGVEKAAQSLLSDFKSGKDLGEYVSDEMILSMDSEKFSKIFEGSSVDLRTRLRSDEPMPVLKSMVGNAILGKVRKPANMTYEGTEQTADGFKTTYRYDDRNIELFWSEDGDGYRVSGTSEDMEKAVGAGSRSLHYIDWTKAYEAGFGKGSGLTGVVADFTWNYYTVDYFSFGWGFEFGHTYRHDEQHSYVGGKDSVFYERGPAELFGFKLNVGGNCPFNLGSKGRVFVMPYGWLDIGWNISEDMYMTAGTHAGARFGYTTKKKNAVFVGAEFYRRNRFKTIGETHDDDGCDIMHSNYFMLKLGYAY